MKVRFEPITPHLLPECRAFNDRLRNHGSLLFGLPEEDCIPPALGSAQIAKTHFAAVDDDGRVRGGVLLQEQRGWLNGKDISLINVQSPITEGIIDRRHSGVALQMLKFLLARSPYVYAVGMGGEQNPFARLLMAAGWRSAPAPFYFHVLQPERFLREIRPLQRGTMRFIAGAASATGLARLAASGWRMAHPRRKSAAVGSTVDQWPIEINRTWIEQRDFITFAAARDAQAVAALYAESRVHRLVLRSNDTVVGWCAAQVKRMSDSTYFGNLNVGTLLDGLSRPTDLDQVIAFAVKILDEAGADVVITNQTHEHWRQALRKAGFLRSKSNYLIVVSPGIRTALKAVHDADERMHVTRGDGDGRLNL